VSVQVSTPPRARLVRDLAAAFVLCGLIAGSLFWRDDAWPLAPFRMFAIGTTRAVWALALEADFADGRTHGVGFDAFGLRRAEVEGQVTRVTQQPGILGDLIRAYDTRVRVASRRIVRLRVLSRYLPVRRGAVARSPAQAGRPRDGAGAGTGAGLYVDRAGNVWTQKVVAEWPPR
jgi:hypothetical protein